MPRRFQVGSGGLTFHVINRGVRRLRLFEDDDDYALLVGCIAEAQSLTNIELFAFCVMPNHFHLVVRPEGDTDLTQFMRLMTLRHSKRWHRRHGTRGNGAVYQGRFRAFPVQTESYFYAACRYVEANPLRAELVSRAQEWPWSSLHQWVMNHPIVNLGDWPVPRPANWLDIVNSAQPKHEIGDVRQSLQHSVPLGGAAWTVETASRLRIDRSLRRPGPKPRAK